MNEKHFLFSTLSKHDLLDLLDWINQQQLDFVDDLFCCCFHFGVELEFMEEKKKIIEEELKKFLLRKEDFYLQCECAIDTIIAQN